MYSQQANGSSRPAPQEVAPEITGAEVEEPKDSQPAKKLQEEAKEVEEEMTPEVMTALNKLGIDEAKDNRVFNPELSDKKRPSLLKSPSDYLPMIRRGFSSRFEEKEEEPVVSVGWKVEVRNRKEREEALRYVWQTPGSLCEAYSRLILIAPRHSPEMTFIALR